MADEEKPEEAHVFTGLERICLALLEETKRLNAENKLLVVEMAGLKMTNQLSSESNVALEQLRNRVHELAQTLVREAAFRPLALRICVANRVRALLS